MQTRVSSTGMTAITANSEFNIEQASKAFSAQATHFDADEESNRILKWMRKQVYRHEEELLLPNSKILELNAGTGIDAIHFAGLGHSVFAIDNAPGMVQQMQKKISGHHLQGRIQCVLCSFTELQTLPTVQFDHVFSNFGGLNCIPDLKTVTQQLPRLLKPGATVTFVIMPSICPWELVQAFRGKPRLAFRRLSRKGTSAHIDGYTFRSYYHSPIQAIKSFDKRFVLAKLRGLASLSPPPYFETFPERHPSLYNTLTRWDERVAEYLPVNRWADHFILTMQYLPVKEK
jgi:ubiquinone/menaquinone biosynthesis C-methylase UbiE